MNKKENIIKAHPIQKANNNLRGRNNINQQINRATKQYSDTTYAEVLALRKRVSDLENSVQKLENKMKSQIVHAPLKEDTVKKKQTISVRPAKAKQIQMYKGPAPQIEARLNRQVQVGPSMQTYSRAAQAYGRSVNYYEQARKSAIQMQQSQITQALIPPKQEQLSFWQKIKKAVKSFFDDEPSKTTTQQSYATSTSFNDRGYNSNTNPRYNQFRQSIPKTTIQIDVKNKSNTNNRKPQEHIFDRYA